ncbi:MAG: hypothetical protein V1816_28375 [Pseudomonadota bacterium]
MNQHTEPGFTWVKHHCLAVGGARGGRIIDELPRPSRQVRDNFLAPSLEPAGPLNMFPGRPGLTAALAGNPEVWAW